MFISSPLYLLMFDYYLPFQQVSVNLAPLEGKNYLVLADCYSGWPEVTQLTHLDTHTVKKALKRIFEMFGITEKIQFRREFKSWCTFLGVIHELSSPYQPESNKKWDP